MKRLPVVLFMLLMILLYGLPVAAGDSDLNIRVESIKERQPVYTSVTDLYGLDILTPYSAERERQYGAWQAKQREQEMGQLFLSGTTQVMDDDMIIQERALEMGLFQKKPDETYFRQRGVSDSDSQSPLLAAALILALCVCGFLFSNSRYKRKKRRQAADVHNSHNALT